MKRAGTKTFIEHDFTTPDIKGVYLDVVQESMDEFSIRYETENNKFDSNGGVILKLDRELIGELYAAIKNMVED